jgi:glucose-1-phosphate cytidylyltransferase
LSHISTGDAREWRMKVMILAGGYGTRISEESGVRPKPMVEIGGKPILWHIMKIYSHFGFNEFVICCGYKGNIIKSFFHQYLIDSSDVTFDIQNDRVLIHPTGSEPWRVTCVGTGEDTMTAGRIKRARRYIGDETFLLTYGDGVADVDIPATIRFHKEQRALCTLTAVQQPGRFGALSIKPDEELVSGFREKSKEDGVLINGGFFVVEPEAFDYIAGDETSWEQEPLQRMVLERKLAAYRHRGFWHAMDTLRDKHVLNEMWDSGKAPWRIWDKGPERKPAPREPAAQAHPDSAQPSAGNGQRPRRRFEGPNSADVPRI